MREIELPRSLTSPRCSVIKLRYGYSIHRGILNAGAARSDCRSHPGTHHRPRLDREDTRCRCESRCCLGARCQQWATHGRVPGLRTTAMVQYCTTGEPAAAATGRLPKRCRRQWYRRAWPAQHDWSRLTLGDVEDDRPRRETGGFPFASDGSELRSQHSAMATCRGLTDGLLHSIAQAGRLQPARRLVDEAANDVAVVH